MTLECTQLLRKGLYRLSNGFSRVFGDAYQLLYRIVASALLPVDASQWRSERYGEMQRRARNCGRRIDSECGNRRLEGDVRYSHLRLQLLLMLLMLLALMALLLFGQRQEIERQIKMLMSLILLLMPMMTPK